MKSQKSSRPIKQAAIAPAMPAAPAATAAPPAPKPAVPVPTPATAGADAGNARWDFFDDAGKSSIRDASLATSAGAAAGNRAAPLSTAAGAGSRLAPAAAAATGTAQRQQATHSQFSAALQTPGLRSGSTSGQALDPSSRDAQQYWARRRQASQERGAQPLNPKSVARDYVMETDASRQAETSADNRGSLMGRLAGFNRVDPRTGDFVPTTSDLIGTNAGGQAGAVTGTLLGIPGVAAGALHSLVSRDGSAASAAIRDLLSLPNHLMGTDFGANLKTDAAVDSGFQAKDHQMRDAFRGQHMPTTTGLVTDPYEPLTEGYKPSMLGAAADMSRYHADDPNSDTGAWERTAAGVHSTVMRNVGPAIAALVGAKLAPAGLKARPATNMPSFRLSPAPPRVPTPPAVIPPTAPSAPTAVGRAVQRIKNIPADTAQAVKNLPTTLARPGAAGATSQGLATLTDTRVADNVLDRVLPAAGAALEGGFATMSANPLYAGAQEIADRSGIQDTANAAGNWLRQLAPVDAGRIPRALTEAGAGIVESLPGMVPYMFRGGKAPVPRASKTDIFAESVLKPPGGLLNKVVPTAGLVGLQATPGVVGQLATPAPTDTADIEAANAYRQYREDTTIAERRGPYVQEAARDRLEGAGFSPEDISNSSSQYIRNVQQPRRESNPALYSANDDLNTPVEPSAVSQMISPENMEATKTYADDNPEGAKQMADTAAGELKQKADTAGGGAEIEALNNTNDLTPAAREEVKHSLLQEGVDAEKLGGWYDRLGAAEKFALWGGVGLTTLGLLGVMNEGGIGSWLAAILGVGAVGLTAGQSGLLGDTAQGMSQQITKPLGAAATSLTDSAVGAVTGSPTAMRALSPVLNSLPESVFDQLLTKMRTSSPEDAADLDFATGSIGNIGGLGIGAAVARKKMIDEKGLSPEYADRILKRWPALRNNPQ